MADLVGKTLGAYRLENALGRGGMATVYRAYQVTVKRYVAIKVMAADIANDPGFVERFSREAEVIASLQHPHILPVIDYGEADGVHYLVMRYLEGGSLEDRMRKKPLTVKEAARFIEQIASALDYAHKRGVIHRDFKASNVLLDDENNTYLTDFGIARLAGNTSKLTATGTVMGTPAYMSPEQAMGRPVDGRSDIYSLGVVVYEMITRRLPFVADTPAALVFQHVYEQPIPPRRLNPSIPEALEAVMLRTLAKDPDERFQTASDMAVAFTEAVQNTVARSGAEEMEGTMVGGPMAPLITPGAGRGTPDKPSTTANSPGGGGSTAAVSRPTAGSSGLAGDNVLSGQQGTNSTVATASKAPVVLIAGVVVLLLILIGGGIVIASLSSQGSANNTKTAEAVAAAATAAHTLTFTPTLTLTATATFTDTPTNPASATVTLTATAINTATTKPSATVPFTETPNATLTSIGQQMNTVAAFQAGQTATQQQGVIASSTALAVQLTAVSAQKATQLAKQTATAHAPPATETSIPATLAVITRSTDTPLAPVIPDTSGGAKYTGAPNAVMTALQDDGLVAAVTGRLLVQPFDYDLPVPDKNSFYWETPNANMAIGDFVMSAQVSWDNANLNDGCGFLFHFSESATKAHAFHSTFIDPSGHVRAITHVSGQDDVTIVNTSTSQINTDPKATNNILLIGQGNAFRLFVNGKRVASFSPKTRFDGGAVTIGATTGEKSGLICHFNNVWAWQLNASSGGSTNGNTGGSATPVAVSGDLASGLMSSAPSTVISALEQANLIPSSVATQVIQLPLDQLSVSTYKPGLGGQSSQVTNKQLKNLVLSVDLTMDMPEGGSCGIYFDGDSTNNLTYLTALFLEHNGSYEAYDRANSTWPTKTVPGSTGTSQLFIVDGTTSNRLTLIVQNSQVTLYVNGTLLVSFADHALDNQSGGAVGYYLSKYKSSVNTDSCIYRNATLWQLP